MTTVAVSAPLAPGGRLISPATRPRTFTRKVIHLVLHSSPANKAILIGAIILAGSALQFFKIVPDTFLSDKSNPVNQYLVKLSWLWTLLFLLAAVTLTAPLYSGLEWLMTIRHFLRIVVGHLVWYCGTRLIMTVDDSVGVCTLEEFKTYETCVKAGQSWSGFDISGHIFLLTYCILTITEEASNCRLELWYSFDGSALQEHRVLAKLKPRARQWLKALYGIADRLIEVTELYGFSLVLVWTVMVTCTAVYFHTFMEKAAGYFLGVGCWYATYGIVYGSSNFVPCRPCDGCLHPIRNLSFKSPQIDD